MENTNQVFLYLNKVLDDYIKEAVQRRVSLDEANLEMKEVCLKELEQRSIELKPHIKTLVENRVKQYLKVYHLKVRYLK